MGRVFKSRAEAEAAGRSVDTSVYPWRVRQTPGADPHIPPAPIVRTDLEAQLAEAMEAVEWSGNDRGNLCPQCRRGTMALHAPDCKLSLALKAFRGEA